MFGLNHVRRAAALIDTLDGQRPDPDRLTEAFGHIWGAVAFSHHWPDDLRADLAGLIVATRRYGNCVETARRMSLGEFREFADDLRRLVGNAARVPDEEPLLAG